MKHYLFPLAMTFATLYLAVTMINGIIDNVINNAGEYADHFAAALACQLFMLLAVAVSFGGLCYILWREAREQNNKNNKNNNNNK